MAYSIKTCINVASRDHAFPRPREAFSLSMCMCASLWVCQLALMCLRVRRPSLYTALHLCKPKFRNGLDFRSAMPPADRVCVRSSLSWSRIHGASKSWWRRKRGQWWVMKFPSLLYIYIYTCIDPSAVFVCEINIK